MAGAAINQVTQIGAEAVRGTVVPATRRLQAVSITISDEKDYGSVRPAGSKFKTAHPLNREWSSGDVSGNGAFNELQYPLASTLSKATPTNIIKVWAANIVLKAGDYVRPSTANGRIYVVTAPAAATAAGTIEPTFPTASGAVVTTGGITYQETGADTIVAREWIFETSTFGKDDVQSYTIEMVDTQRNRGFRAAYCLFNAFSIESARSDEVSIGGEIVGRTLENGVAPTSAGIVVSRVVPMTTAMVNVYMADTPAGLELEANKLTENFAYSIEYGGRYNQTWVHDRSLNSWKEHVEAEPGLEMSLTLADDAFADSILAGAKVGDRKFVRFDVLGGEIAPGTGIRYRFQWDIACQVNDAPSRDDNDDAYVSEISFEAEHDDNWGKATRARLVNASTAL